MTDSWNVGDRVMVAPTAGFPAHLTGVELEIAELPKGSRGVNYKARRVAGGPGARGPAHAFVAYDPNPQAQVETFVPAPANGSVVRVQGGLKGDQGAEFFVVLGPVRNRPDATQVTILGGTEPGYWKVPNRLLTVVAGTFVPEGE